LFVKNKLKIGGGIKDKLKIAHELIHELNSFGLTAKKPRLLIINLMEN